MTFIRDSDENHGKFPIPVIKALRKMGQDINDARRRRHVTIELMPECTVLSRATIGKIELKNCLQGGYFTLALTPGVISLWRGWTRLMNMVEDYKILAGINTTDTYG